MNGMAESHSRSQYRRGRVGKGQRRGAGREVGGGGAGDDALKEQVITEERASVTHNFSY